MRILNVIWAFSTGGIGKLFLTYNALGTYDSIIDVTSVCIDLQNCDYDRTPLYKAGIRIIPIKKRLDFSWINKLGAIAEEIKPDVIFCHGFNGPIIIKLASWKNKRLKKTMVCTYHGLYNPPTRRKKLIAPIINKIQAWIYKRYAAKVILVAKYSGEYLLSQGVPKEKMIVVYNGIDQNEPKEKPVSLSHNCVNIGVVGRLDLIKGIKYLIEAIPLILKQAMYKFHIYIVGDGPEMESLCECAKQLKVDSYISFTGYQSNVSAWLRAWDIFCLPSLQENHSIALLEAMRAGKGIVCTDVGGNPETVVNGLEALLVPPQNSDALSKALIKMINSADLRTMLGVNASTRFHNYFTEEVMCRRLCNILKNIIEVHN